MQNDRSRIVKYRKLAYGKNTQKNQREKLSDIKCSCLMMIMFRVSKQAEKETTNHTYPSIYTYKPPYTIHAIIILNIIDRPKRNESMAMARLSLSGLCCLLQSLYLSVFIFVPWTNKKERITLEKRERIWLTLWVGMFFFVEVVMMQ